MKINKWWGLLIGLIISIIVGFFIGGYTEGKYLVLKNIFGLLIIATGFLIGWGNEETKDRKKTK